MMRSFTYDEDSDTTDEYHNRNNHNHYDENNNNNIYQNNQPAERHIYIEEGRVRNPPQNYEEYEEYESNMSTYNGDGNGDLRQIAFGDEEYFDRMFNLLNGRTTGRRIKRVIFKYGLAQTVIGFILIVLSGYEGTYLLILLDGVMYGNPISLMWVVAIFTFINGLLSLFAVYYWASLCTNRYVLCNSNFCCY